MDNDAIFCCCCGDWFGFRLTVWDDDDAEEPHPANNVDEIEFDWFFGAWFGSSFDNVDNGEV